MSRPTLDQATAASQHRQAIAASNERMSAQLAVASCRIRCECGTLEGTLTRWARARRVICYCHDCQAFAQALNQGGRVLDELGGSDILLTLPRNLTLTQGAQELACLRLTAGGLLRWYARCCSTPIASTLPKPKLSFMGLSITCLDPGALSREAVVGPVTAWSFTDGARKGVGMRPQEVGRGSLKRFAMLTILRARLNGDYRRTPFFNLDNGTPVAHPKVLSPTELARLMAVVRQGGSAGAGQETHAA